MDAKVNRGLWVTQPPRAVLAPGFLERLRDLRFNTVAVMVDSMKPGWDPKWTTREVQRLCALALHLDLEVVVTCWPDPSEAGIDRMIADWATWLPFGLAAIEVDVEAGWYVREQGRRRMHPQYATAGTYLGQRLREICDRHDVRLELTTHTGHVEITPRAVVTPFCHRLSLQAYSVRQGPDGREYAWDDPVRGPGLAQERAIRLARKLPRVQSGELGLTLGLAAWAQDWPGHTVGEALQEAYDAAWKAEPREMRWWSAVHLLDDPEAVRWFEG